MTHDKLCSARRQRSLFAFLPGAYFLMCVFALSVETASGAGIQDKPGKVRPETRQTPLAPGAAGESPNPEADNGKKKARPRPDRNYAGISISTGAIVKTADSEAKKYSLDKQGETTRARPARSAVEHGGSAELQARNEKLRKIREHFKTELDKREERNQGKSDSSHTAR